MHIFKWDFFLSWKIHFQDLVLTLSNRPDSVLCMLLLKHETESTDKVLLIPLPLSISQYLYEGGQGYVYIYYQENEIIFRQIQSLHLQIGLSTIPLSSPVSFLLSTHSVLLTHLILQDKPELEMTNYWHVDSLMLTSVKLKSGLRMFLSLSIAHLKDQAY